MAKIVKYKTLEESLTLLARKARKKSLSVKEILEILLGKGRSIALIFLSLPFCQPIQIPGLSIPFGILIGLLGLRMAFGKHIWLPKFVLSKQVSSSAIQKITQKVLKAVKKLKHLIRPRLEWICHHKAMHIFNGLVIFLLGIFLALPLPIPLTNLSAAWSIFLMALGFLEHDGLFVIFGYSITLLTLIFFAYIALQINIWIY